MRPIFTPQLLSFIAECVSCYPDRSPGLEGHDWAVATYRAIPIGYDLTSVGFLTTRGTFFFLDLRDDESPPEPLESIWAQLVAIRLAARTYPELLSALPQRPPTAVECEHCGGRGFTRADEVRFIPVATRGEDSREFPCWLCGTMGWHDNDGPLFLLPALTG